MDKWLIKRQSESGLSTGSQSKSEQFTESQLKSRPSSESHPKSGLSTESQCASGLSTEAQSKSLISSESQPKSGPFIESHPRSRSSIESQLRSGPSTSYVRSRLCSETQFESEPSTHAQLESGAYSEVESVETDIGHSPQSPRKKVELQKKVQSRYKFLNDWLKDKKFQGWLSKTNLKNYKGEPASLHDENHLDWVPFINMGHGIDQSLDQSNTDPISDVYKRLQN
ncbi:unnamed protein product [Phaedon cochleariae]|uniref:Uncharacterized protein n=1 Tax=Phaedon cochleariae TaxID=80249 RepID=A0A9N9SF34_PHACE|nr:unnamed protein product [Phaedon cochleariae]